MRYLFIFAILASTLPCLAQVNFDGTLLKFEYLEDYTRPGRLFEKTIKSKNHDEPIDYLYDADGIFILGDKHGGGGPGRVAGVTILGVKYLEIIVNERVVLFKQIYKQFPLWIQMEKVYQELTYDKEKNKLTIIFKPTPK